MIPVFLEGGRVSLGMEHQDLTQGRNWKEHQA